MAGEASVQHTKKPCAILKCTCKHDYQDRKYGKQLRLMNPMKNDRYRCTVCHRIP